MHRLAASLLSQTFSAIGQVVWQRHAMSNDSMKERAQVLRVRKDWPKAELKAAQSVGAAGNKPLTNLCLGPLMTP